MSHGPIDPLRNARIAGIFYLLAVLTGVFVEFVVRGRWGFAAILIPISCYVAATLLLYGIFKPVNRGLSLLAAFFGIATCVIGALGWHPQGADIGLVSLGMYCLLVGYLILRSTFLPRLLGVAMVCAGLAWLTYLWPAIATVASPYNMAIGALAQLSLCVWLLVMGVDASKWKTRAQRATAPLLGPS